MQIFFIRTIKEGYTGCPVIVRFIQRLFKIVLNITKHQSGIYLGTPIHRFNAFPLPNARSIQDLHNRIYYKSSDNKHPTSILPNLGAPSCEPWTDPGNTAAEIAL